MKYPDENKILLLLGRLEGKVDSILKTQASYDHKISQLDRRMNHLERIQAYWAGGAALLGIITGIGIQICFKGGGH